MTEFPATVHHVGLTVTDLEVTPASGISGC
jgi:hypothetical protein